MNFLFINPRYHINTHYMAKALVVNGHYVDILSIYRGGSEDHETIKPKVIDYSKLFVIINSIFNRGGGKLIKNDFEIKYSFAPVSKLFKEISKKKVDILVLKNIHSLNSIFAMFIGWLFRKKIIILLQIDKYRQKEKSLSVYFVGKICNAKVVTPILGNKKYKNRNDNLFYIPFAIDINNFNKEYFLNDKINIMCVGKFQERKGQLILLEAINKLKNEYSLKITLIGEKDEEEYTKKIYKFIEENNLNDVVKIKNDIIHEEVMKEYNRNDLFVLPSWSEAASIAILEAMSKKLPVISSDDNGTKCYIEEGGNGYIFKNRDINDLFEKIRLIIKDRNNLIKMGKRSFEICEENHSFNSFHKNFLEIVNKK